MEKNNQERCIRPYRIIPFDIGCRISDEDRQTIYRYFFVSGYPLESLPALLNNLSSDILFRIRLTEKIRLYIYAFGVGVFVVQDNVFPVREDKYAVAYCASRKKAHAQLLSHEHECSPQLQKIMEDLRYIAGKSQKLRNSASKNWEKAGLSYVMTVSFLQNPSQQVFEFSDLSEIERRNLMIMLEPSIAHQEDSLVVSLNAQSKQDPYDYDMDDMQVPRDWIRSKDCSIYISWAAVVVCMNQLNEKHIDFMECLEVDLQAMWLYIYCLYYNLRQTARNQQQKISGLKSELFHIRRKYNAFKSKNDSSLPAYVSNIRNELILTSGIDEEYQKYSEYLNFYVEEAENLDKERQRKYNKLSEILLFIIAYVQVAPMLYAFLCGEAASMELLPTLFIVLAAVISCVIIIVKE